jgi:serine/threonine-protein kinase
VSSIKSLWSRRGLQVKIFVSFVVVVVALVGGVLAFSYQRANRLAQESLDQALATTRSLYENLEVERLEKLELINSAVTESPIFKAVVSETDMATVLDSAQEMVHQVGTDFMIVTDSEGMVLARTDAPGEAGADLSETLMVMAALEWELAGGIWADQGNLFHAVSVPLTVGPSLLGAVVSGYTIDDELAQHIKRFAGCEVVFYVGTGSEQQLVGSTLSQHMDVFSAWLAGNKDPGRADGLRLDLGGEAYEAVVVPMQSMEGEVVGTFTALRSRDRELAAFRDFQKGVLTVGLLTLGLAVMASFVLSGGITRPIKRLVTLTDRIREGDYASQVDVNREDEIGALARSFRALMGELREKALMEKYISKSAAEMIHNTDALRVQASERRPVTVLFSDLRAFKALGHESKPENVLSDVNQALSGQAELVVRFGGHVDKFVGDRMMAVFKGPDTVWPAVRCANAVQQFLDEEIQGKTASLLPSIGISTGEAVFGNVGSSDRQDYTLLGPSVHVAARLCDDALPGDILLSGEAYAKVQDRVAAETLASMKIHGLEDTVSVYLLSSGTVRQRGEEASRAVTGATRYADDAESGTTLVQSPASPPDLGPGFLLGGRYEIQRVIGSGGMGMVYQARDRELDEMVAIKTLRPDITNVDPRMLDRFKQEIRVARSVTHRNVVRTYDFGDVQGVKFISMEYVQGVTLKQLIRKKGALPLNVGLRIAKQTSAGLAAAHHQGIVHRDVKPQNIILTQASEVKIMDFGIARPKESEGSGITATGLIMGTPDYMSPEQVQSKPDLDHRSDIYSLGVVFYEMFTGALPFSGDSAINVAMKHVQEQPPPPRTINQTIPPPLELIILRCLHKSPAERYQKVEELQNDLLEPTVRHQ